MPSKRELMSYYNQSYSVPIDYFVRMADEQRMLELDRFVGTRDGSLLEVGCSYGHELAFARELGWDVSGVEVSSDAAAYARDRFGLNVTSGDLADFGGESSSFDVVVMSHVLEHMLEPFDALRHVRSLLRDGGLLCLRLPNVDSLGSRIAGTYWEWNVPPAHLWYFSPTSIVESVQRLGFEAIAVETARGPGSLPLQHLLDYCGGTARRIVRRLTKPGDSPGSARQCDGYEQALATSKVRRAYHRARHLLGRDVALQRAIEAWANGRLAGNEIVLFARRVPRVHARL